MSVSKRRHRGGLTRSLFRDDASTGRKSMKYHKEDSNALFDDYRIEWLPIWLASSLSLIRRSYHHELIVSVDNRNHAIVASNEEMLWKGIQLIWSHRNAPDWAMSAQIQAWQGAAKTMQTRIQTSCEIFRAHTRSYENKIAVRRRRDSPERTRKAFKSRMYT